MYSALIISFHIATLCDMVSCFRQFLQQQGNPLGHFGRKRFKVELHIKLPCRKLRFQAAFQLDIVKEVVVQGFRNVDELLHAYVVSLEDGIHIGPCAIDAAGELGHAYSLFVKYLFDKVSDVYSVWFGHELISSFCIKAANVLIWMWFCFMITVVIIYGFVKIIYSACLSSQKQHEKSVEMSLA